MSTQTIPDGQTLGNATSLASMHCLTLPGPMLQRGFWLYVWRVQTPKGERLYVGRTESPRFHRRPLASFHATISSTSRCA
jgi:hypothetical protein